MKKFDFEKAVKELLTDKRIGGKEGVLTQLIKELVEEVLEAEIESHIAD
jgi:transposase-like protein